MDPTNFCQESRDLGQEMVESSLFRSKKSLNWTNLLKII